MGYDFEIVYKTGTLNRVMNALSRKLEEEGEREADLGVISKLY